MRRQLMCAAALVLLTSQAGAQPTEQQPGRLADLIAIVDAVNPELGAARSDIAAKTARIKPSGTLADPVVSAGFMGGFTSVPFFPGSANPDALRQFSIAQELPYPGKLNLRSSIASADVEVARHSVEALRLQRIADFKSRYVDYRLAWRSRDILARNRERLRQMVTLVETRFAVGQGGQQDVVKSQLELSLLTERQTLVDRQLEVLRAQLNALLDRTPEQPIDPELAFDVRAVALDAVALRALAEVNDPAIKRDAQATLRNERALALARKAVLPDFGARVSFQKFAAGMPWMYGIEIMANVPVFAGRKQSQMVAEAESDLATSRAAAGATRAAIYGDIGNLVAMAQASQRLVTLYQDSILPQAGLALEASLAGYETGRVDFLTVITNVTTILEYELAVEEQHAGYLRSLVSLEPLVGETYVN